MDKVKREDVELLLSTREALYALFHRALGCEPNDALIQVLTGEESRVLLSVVPESEAGRGAFRDYLTEIDRLVERYAVSPSEVLSGMKDDYTALFFGPGRLEAPPSESYYRDSEGSFLSKHTLSVRREYARWGFGADEHAVEPDDTLVYELDFMRALAKKSLASWLDGELDTELHDAQVRFVNEHLLRWLGLYAGDMRACSRPGVYQQLVQMLWMFVNWDIRMLQSLPLDFDECASCAA